MIVGRFLRWAEAAPPGARAEATHALARAFLHSPVGADTKEAIEAALTVLLDDPAPEVRFAMADALAGSAAAPRHIILALVADSTEIAALVLSRSPLFDDGELVDIVAAAADPLQVAIAFRPLVRSAVSAAIAEVGCQEACLALIANPAAAIARISLRRIAERFGDNPEIREAMLGLRDVPVDIRQLLVQRLSDALGNLVSMRAWMESDRVRNVTRDACDRATIALAAESESEDLIALVEHLRVTGQLTTPLLLRAVCAGNAAFFEAALSVLAGMPEERVASLVRSGRSEVLRALCQRAGLPRVAFDAFEVALEACRDLGRIGDPVERYRAIRWTVERVVERYQTITDGEMNELMSMLRRFAADAARSAARDYAEIARAAWSPGPAAQAVRARSASTNS